jgi:long-chain acyl-CoA synthetase
MHGRRRSGAPSLGLYPSTVRPYFFCMNLALAFSESARTHRQRPVIFWGEQEFSYETLLGQARSLAGHLVKEFGVRRGDRVALWLRNCPEFVPALYAILGTGAVVVPINNFLKPDEVAYILKDCDAKVIITDGTMAEALGKLMASVPQLRSWNVEGFGGLGDGGSTELAPPELDAAGATENDLAVIIYTSGTTGHPKGAMLSHGNLLVTWRVAGRCCRRWTWIGSWCCCRCSTVS